LSFSSRMSLRGRSLRRTFSGTLMCATWPRRVQLPHRFVPRLDSRPGSKTVFARKSAIRPAQCARFSPGLQPKIANRVVSSVQFYIGHCGADVPRPRGNLPVPARILDIRELFNRRNTRFALSNSAYSSRLCKQISVAPGITNVVAADLHPTLTARTSSVLRVER